MVPITVPQDTASVSTSPPPAVQVHAARLSYGGQALFDDLDFHLPAGCITGLLGPSGVGKSSLVRLVAGLERQEGGRVDCSDGQPLAGRVAWMAQDDLLLPWLTVRENLVLGHRLRRQPPPWREAEAMLARVGLADVAGLRPSALSGGMRQRAALARTLLEDKPVILMDEPFSALDVPTRLRLQDLAADLLQGRTVLLVTHDPLEALRLCHRVQVLSGRPARLSEPLLPDGAIPRAPTEPGLLTLQGRLLEHLHQGAAP